MVEWSKDHMAIICSLKLNTLGFITGTWLKWRPGGALRGKWRQLVRNVGVWVCGKMAPLRLYPPHVSFMDRWVGLREQVLNVPIACR
jgi:hypothetical protein